MNILHTIETYGEYTGARAVRLLSESLVERGHAVTVATGGGRRVSEVINGVRVERFPISGNNARGIRGDAGAIREYRSLLCNSQFDILLQYFAQSWATDLAFPVLGSVPAKKIIVPCGYSKLADSKYARYFVDLPRYLKQYDHIVYLSHDYKDKKFGDVHGANISGKFSTIANCADEREFLALPPKDFWLSRGVSERHVVLGVSNHAFAKRHEWFWAAALRARRPDTAFVLIGKRGAHPLKACTMPCRVAAAMIPRARVFENMPRAEVVSAMRSSSVLLHPSRTECDSIVMYEALAAKLPVVASPVGSAPEFSEYISIAKNSRDMAAAIKKLLDDKPFHAGRASRGYDLWKNKYTLTRMTDQYEALYRHVREP